MQWQRRYRAFLLRLWRDKTEAPWRIMLEDTETHQRRHFPDLESLQTFLEQDAGPFAPDAPASRDGES